MTARSASTRLDIVPVGLSHCDLLAALHGAAFADHWSARAFAELLVTAGSFAMLAERAPEPGAPPLPLGLVVARVAAGECEILTLAVLPAVRRQEVGRALLRAALAAAASAGAHAVFLEVAADNEAARRLYASEGFALVGRRTGYYRPDAARGAVDALVMRREIAETFVEKQ